MYSPALADRRAGFPEKCPKTIRKISENMSQTCPKISEKCPNTCPKHVRNISENMSQTSPKMSEHMSQTYPKIFQHPQKIRKHITSGRARNRTRYPPDPTPAPVRVPAHWANPVTTNRVSKDLLCIKIRDKSAPQ